MNAYRFFGIILTVIGFLVASYSYLFIDSIPLTAVGFSTVILGFTGLCLPSPEQKVTESSFEIFIKTSEDNVTTVLKEFQLTEKAVYFPQTMIEGNSKALIPLRGEENIKRLKEMLPGNMLLRYMPASEDLAVAIVTPGNACLDMLENKPDGTASEIKSALNHVLKKMAGIATAVKVELNDTHVIVDLNDMKIIRNGGLYHHYLGSPLGSIVAAICSEAIDKPVKIRKETVFRNESKITLEVLLKTHNALMMSMAAALTIINIILILAGLTDLKLYYSLDIIAFLVIVLSFRVEAKALTSLRVVGSFLFVVFLGVIALKVILDYI